MEEMGSSPSERLRGLLGFLKDLSGQRQEFEPLAALSDAQQKEWKEIERLSSEAEMIVKEAEARRELFWVHLRRALGPEGDREGLRIEGGMVLGSKPTPVNRPRNLEQLED